MVRGVATPKKVRDLIIKMFGGGKKMRQIARDLDLSKSTVSYIIKSYGENGSTDIKGKSPGRPRLVTDRQRRELVKICKKNRRGTLRDVTSEWNEAGRSSYCRETCRKWIHKSGLGFYKAKEKPLLTERQKKKRLSWCKERVGWSQEQWNSVIFSDESKFDVCVGDNRKRVIRTKKEAFHKDCLKRTVKFASGEMIWGCMSAKGVGNMQFINGTVNAVKYQEILENNLIPSIQKLCPAERFIFQQDGASCHTARTTRNWFENHAIQVMDWPSSSPDLNVIETLWHKMKQKLRNDPQRTHDGLRSKIREVWDSVEPEECQALVNSMPKRILAVIQAKGDVTSY